MCMSQTDENPHMKDLRKVVAKASTKPGVYRWLNEAGDVLYVGKAKNLKNRLKSYVQPAKDTSLGPWKLSMIDKIANLDVTVTSNELEALILETNLIKELQPKYNVLMKDGKHYVYVRISTQDPYPCVDVVRKMQKDKATYFGPYLSSYQTKQILDVLHDVFQYRAASAVLDALNRGKEPEVDQGHLEYQIGKCNGLGFGTMTDDQYQAAIQEVIRFFKGDHSHAIEKVTSLMQEAAVAKKFERAAALRDNLQFIQRLSEQQIVSDTSRENTDCIGIALHSGHAQIVLLREREGKLIAEQAFSIRGQAEDHAEVLTQFLPQFYSEEADLPDRILIGMPLEDAAVLEEWLTQLRGKKVEIKTPERGKKSKLLILAEKNAEEKVKQQEAKWESAKRSTEEALAELKELLDLSDIPKRIEGYDISHLGGTETVGSMVVTLNGTAANKQYRSFTIRSLAEGEVDDYAALKEVLTRRLIHLLADVKQRELFWKEKGVVIGKAKKAEQKIIEEIIESQPELAVEENMTYKDFLVAREEDEIVGIIRLTDNDGKILELKSLWVAKKHRGDRLGQLLIRKVLQSYKKEKIYLITEDHMLEYYSQLSFRHVQEPPEILQKKTEEFCKKNPDLGITCGTIMVSLPAERKTDASLQARPDLLVIDGGKGQLSTVVDVLKNLSLDIPVIGLAKREEEIFLPGASLPIDVPHDSEAKFLLMRLRNEAHRFANRHREKRGKSTAIHSALDEVPGIGDKTKKQLLKAFGSVAGIRSAADEDLMLHVSEAQLSALRERL